MSVLTAPKSWEPDKLYCFCLFHVFFLCDSVGIGKAVRGGKAFEVGTPLAHQFNFHVESIMDTAASEEEGLGDMFRLISHINANGKTTTKQHNTTTQQNKTTQ